MPENQSLRFCLKGDATPNPARLPCNFEDFDLLLLADSRLPRLEAPVASWVLARLLAEDRRQGGSFFIEEAITAEGGGFTLSLEVFDGDNRPCALLEVNGNTAGVSVFGHRVESLSRQKLLLALLDFLLDEADVLAVFSLIVVDPEWAVDADAYQPLPEPDSRNYYGWDGSTFLGADNVWCAFDFGTPRPECYRDYLDACLLRSGR